MERHQLPHGEIVHARVEEVYPTVADGSVTLCHVDGPYNLGKAKWDRIKDLAAWYRPHIAEWGRLCAPSASVYLWNTAEGWAAIHPEMVAAGWTFRALVTWDKGIGFLAGKIDTEGTRTWPDVTEVCGFYQREAWDPLEARRMLRLHGHHPSAVDAAVGVSCMASRKWLGSDVQAQAPTAADLSRVRASIPGLPHPWDSLNPRPHFSLPSGVTNVWAHPQVQGAERLTGTDGATLHPCQKPLLFARRIVEASSRPGDIVFEPFGGTCRIAAACEAIGHYEPEKARRYVCVEMDEDGRGYIPAVLAALRGELPRGKGAEQVQMFGKT